MSSKKQEENQSLVAQAIRHPLQTMMLLNRNNLKLFFSTMHHSGFKNALSTTSRVLQNYSDDVKRVEQITVHTAHLDSINENMEFPVFDNPLVSIVIPVYNQYKFTIGCLDSILKNINGIPYEIIIGDDNSTDETKNISEHVSNITVVHNDKNLGFTLNCNNASKKARGKYIHFLNNDTIVCENWLKPLVDLISSSDSIGVVGSKLIYPDGLLQEAGGIIWSDGTAMNYGKGSKPNEPRFNYVKDVDYITGASLMIHKDLFEELGGFDPIYAPAYCEDSDLCLAVHNKGYKVLYQPLSEIVHFEGMTHGKAVVTRINPHQQINVEKLRKKWESYLTDNCNRPGNDIYHARDRSMDRKTILLVTNHLPAKDLDSDSKPIYGYIEHLCSIGYNVKLSMTDSNYDQNYSLPLQQMGVEIYFGTPSKEYWKSLVKKYKKKVEHVVFFDYGTVLNYGKYLDKHMKAKIHYFIPCNIRTSLEREYDLTHDSRTLMELAIYKRRNPRLVKRVDHIIVTNNMDMETFGNMNGNITRISLPCTVENPIPNISNHELLFVAFMGSRYNIDAMKWFISEILPLLVSKKHDIKLHIVGGMIPEEISALASENIIIDGHLSDEKISEMYSKCSVFIDPVRFSAGVRCHTIDAMAKGIPIVSTKIGMEGFDKLDYPSFTKPEEFADEIIKILENKEYAEKLSRVGLQYVSDNFTEDKLITRLRKIFD